MFQSEGHNPLKNCELVYSSYYFKWPKVADAVIEASFSPPQTSNYAPWLTVLESCSAIKMRQAGP